MIGSPAHILVVDDDPALLSTLARLLKRAGYQVQTAPSAEEALLRLSSHLRFELLLLDLYLPHMQGLDLLRLCTQYPSPPAVIILTSHPEVETAVQALRLGVCDYITKPFIPRQFLARIEQVLALRAGRRQRKEEIETSSSSLVPDEERVSAATALSEPPALRILLAGDGELVHEGLRQVFAEHLGALVEEAQEWAELCACIRARAWDVVVVDLAMLKDQSLENLRWLCGLGTVLVLYRERPGLSVQQVLSSGAAGCLTATCPAGLWIEAVNSARRGERFVSPDLAVSLIAPEARETPPHASLSPRQFQVLRGLAVGKAIKELAAELGLSEQTIRRYRLQVLKKMEMRTDAELIRYAVEHRLID